MGGVRFFYSFPQKNILNKTGPDSPDLVTMIRTWDGNGSNFFREATNYGGEYTWIYNFMVEMVGL